MPPAVVEARVRQGHEVSPETAKAFELEAANRRRLEPAAKPIVAIGDSWLFDQWQRDYLVVRGNLSKSLLPLGYKDTARNDFRFVSAGRPLREMADDRFLTDVTNYLADQPDTFAVVLGGGGVDVVDGFLADKPLYRIVRPIGSAGPPMDEQAVADFIDVTLYGYYKTILDRLTEATNAPIMIHGYDHPVPDNRGDMFGIVPSGPWLRPLFALRGYDIPANAAHFAQARDVMRQLIDRLNAMVAKVATGYPNVHAVNLTGTLAAAFGNPDNYKQLWNNELHANQQGFDALAAVMAQKLAGLKIPAMAGD
jgi:hypothetical protein